MNIDDLPSLLNVKELAELFRINTRTAYNMINRKGIPVIRSANNGGIRIPKDSLKEWIKENERRVSSEDK